MVKRIVLWLLVICCMVMIFCFSAQPSDESASLSDGMLDKFLAFFNIYLANEKVEFLRLFIRKVAHFSVYGLLGYLWYMLFFVGYNIKNTAASKAAVVFSGLYALTDEIHQVFVPGRSCKITDVFIDTLGATCGVVLAMVLCLMILGRRKND